MEGIDIKFKLNNNLKIFILGIFFISLVCINNINVKATKNISSNNNNEELIVSTYDTGGKSSITKVNPETKEQSILISNQDVWLSGNLSDDKSSLVYMNALGKETWQVFSLDLKTKQIKKLTTNKLGKFGGKAGDNDTIFFEVIDPSSALSKIVKYNIKDNSSIIFDELDKDRVAEVYDIRDNKIIAVMNSNSEEEKRRTQANKTQTPIKPIEYSIYEIDSDNSNMKKIASINATKIDNISYNYDCKKAIISGKNINNENCYGIYEVSTENGQVTKFLTDDMIFNNKDYMISAINNSYAVMSRNGNVLYFSGVPKGGRNILFQDITSMPQNVYSYNLKTNKIEKVYENGKPTIITDLTIAY